MLTRKHFKALADALATTRERNGLTTPEAYGREAQWEYDVRAIADVCERSNPRFDCAKFLAACRGMDVRSDGIYVAVKS